MIKRPSLTMLFWFVAFVAVAGHARGEIRSVNISGTPTGNGVSYPNNTSNISCYSESRICRVSSVEQIGFDQIGRMGSPISYDFKKRDGDERPAGAAMIFISGDELLAKCTAGVSKSADRAGCVGYIMGIADAMAGAQDGGQSLGGWRACLSAGVTRGQAKDIAVEFLRIHPEKRRFVAGSVVAQALAEAFPCPPP
jgi:hypothetical protein